MLLLAAAALAAAPQPTIIMVPDAQPKLANSSVECPRISAYVAGTETRYDGKPLTPHKLTELPPANMYVGVLRLDENGCLAPIVIQFGVGGR